MAQTFQEGSLTRKRGPSGHLNIHSWHSSKSLEIYLQTIQDFRPKLKRRNRERLTTCFPRLDFKSLYFKHLLAAFSQSLGGSGFYLPPSAHPFPTVFWKKADGGDSRLGTLLSSCELTPNCVPTGRHLLRIKTWMSLACGSRSQGSSQHDTKLTALSTGGLMTNSWRQDSKWRLSQFSFPAPSEVFSGPLPTSIFLSYLSGSSFQGHRL